MVQNNYTFFKKFFKRIELRTIDYHVTWFSRYITTEVLKAKEYPRDCILPVFNLIYYVNNALIKKDKKLVKWDERSAGGGFCIKTMVIDMPEVAFYGHRVEKKNRADYLDKLEKGLSFMNDLFGNEVRVLSEGIVVTHNNGKPGWIKIILTHGASEVVLQVVNAQDEVYPYKDVVIGKVRIPPSVFKKRYPILYPASAWTKIKKVSDLLALSYINTLFLNGKRSTISYEVLSSSLLKYLPRNTYYYKNKKTLVKQMNKFCTKIGIPEVFEYK